MCDFGINGPSRLHVLPSPTPTPSSHPTASRSLSLALSHSLAPSRARSFCLGRARSPPVRSRCRSGIAMPLDPTPASSPATRRAGPARVLGKQWGSRVQETCKVVTKASYTASNAFKA
eukprot:6177071-Pleurochrysis_carterae.AAC.4